ncbi:hypothetical protein Tco_0872954 [Tanacetum coccineum]
MTAKVKTTQGISLSRTINQSAGGKLPDRNAEESCALLEDLTLYDSENAHDEEACLEEQILSLMHRFADRFINRRPEINRLNSLPDQALIEYGRYALGCMTGADMKKDIYLKMARDELLRSMEEKRQLIKNYKEM